MIFPMYDRHTLLFTMRKFRCLSSHNDEMSKLRGKIYYANSYFLLTIANRMNNEPAVMGDVEISEEFTLTNLPKTKNSEIQLKEKNKKQSDLDNPIKLFVRDINLLRCENGTLKTSLFGEPADSVLIFGDLFVRKRIERFKKAVYQLDDGTESITVYYNHGNRFNKESVKLMHIIERKMHCIKEKMLGMTQFTDETIDAMSGITEITNARVMQQYKYFDNGIKAFVLGTLFINKSSELCIAATHVQPVKQNCDTDEIFWNLTLTELYENQYDLEKL